MNSVLIIFFLLLFLVPAAAALYVICTYLLFFYDRSLDQKGVLHITLHKHAILPSKNTIIHAILREVIATALCIYLYPFKWYGGGPSRSDYAYQRPILLVHGYMHNQSGWLWFRHQLAQQGLGPIFSLNLHPSTASIEVFAEEVARKAAEIERKTGVWELVLIGHSMGGLVSAFYAEQLAPAGKVIDVITLGTPFFGTRLNVFGQGRCNKEMAPHSPFLQHLQMLMKSDKKIRFYHIASLLDNVIFPYFSCFTGQPQERELLTSSHGHLTLLFSKQIVNQVAFWLKQAIPINKKIQTVNFAPAPHGAKKRPI